MDYATAECGALIGIETMTSQLTTCHPTDGVDEVTTEQIFELILIRVMGVGLTIKVVSQGILDPVFVMGILYEVSAIR